MSLPTITTLATPIALALLALVALLPLLWSRRRAAALLYADTSRALPLTRTWRTRLRFIPSLLRLLALAALALAIARPQERSGKTLSSTEGVALQIVLDRSSSMAQPMVIDDTVTTRLEATKSVIHDFIMGDSESFAGRPGDLIGLVTFAAIAETVCPLVRHHEPLADLAATTTLARQRTAEDGTAIGDALALAIARLKNAENELAAKAASTPDATPEFTIRSKAIILLTDGENNRGDIAPLAAARLARDWNIKIYAIGIGDPRRAGLAGFFGASADQTLQQLADTTGGRYFNATDADTLRDIYATIDALETTRIQQTEYSSITEHFPPLALAALALLAAEALLGATLLRRAPL